MVYYDVCEDPEELQSLVQTGIQHGDPPSVIQLRRRLQTLETKRGSICARRAYLRNKKVQGGGIDTFIPKRHYLPQSLEFLVAIWQQC